MMAFSNFSVTVAMGQDVMDCSCTCAVCTCLYHLNMSHEQSAENGQNHWILHQKFVCLATAGCFARGGFGGVSDGQDP